MKLISFLEKPIPASLKNYQLGVILKTSETLRGYGPS
jgi:hypothetical protein